MSGTFYIYPPLPATDQNNDPLSASNPYAVNIRIMIAAIVVLFAVVLFIVALHLYAKWFWKNSQFNPRRRRLQQLDFIADEPLNPGLVRGLDRSLVESLPIFSFKSENMEPIDCPVCLCEFEENEKGRTLPKCSHAFHIECIDMWFLSHSTCPLCRSSIRLEENAKLELGNPADFCVQIGLEEPPISDDFCSSSSSNSEPVPNPNEDSTNGSAETGIENTDPDDSCIAVADKKNASWRKTHHSRATSRSNSELSSRRNLRVEIPRPQMDRSQSISGYGFSSINQGSKSPASRWRSLRRVLSRERRVAPSASASSDIEQGSSSGSAAV